MLNIYHEQLRCHPSACRYAVVATCVYSCKLFPAHRDVSAATAVQVNSSIYLKSNLVKVSYPYTLVKHTIW